MSVIKVNQRNYEPTGVEGISMCMLWENEINGGASLVKMEANSSFPNHGHPGWEQVFLLSGKVRIGNDLIEAGDYSFTSAGEFHSACAEEETELLVFSEKALRSLINLFWLKGGVLFSSNLRRLICA